MVAEEALEGGGQRFFLKAHRMLACCSKCAWRACDAMRCGMRPAADDKAAAGSGYLLRLGGLLSRLLAFTLGNR